MLLLVIQVSGHIVYFLLQTSHVIKFLCLNVCSLTCSNLETRPIFISHSFRSVAWPLDLCHYSDLFLHHSHLQAQLEESNRAGKT